MSLFNPLGPGRIPKGLEFTLRFSSCFCFSDSFNVKFPVFLETKTKASNLQGRRGGEGVAGPAPCPRGGARTGVPVRALPLQNAVGTAPYPSVPERLGVSQHQRALLAAGSPGAGVGWPCREACLRAAGFQDGRPSGGSPASPRLPGPRLLTAPAPGSYLCDCSRPRGARCLGFQCTPASRSHSSHLVLGLRS